MIGIISGYAIPIALAPLAIWALRPLFARFVRDAASLFLDEDCDSKQSEVVAMTMARVNVVVFVLIWLGVFTSRAILDQPIAVPAAVMIGGLLLGLWLTTGIARNHLKIGGWSSMQVGLLVFAGGNLPLLLLIPIVLVVS